MRVALRQCYDRRQMLARFVDALAHRIICRTRPLTSSGVAIAKRIAEVAHKTAFMESLTSPCGCPNAECIVMQMYYRPKSCSLAARIVLHECELACDFIDASELLHTPTFRALNPLGQIPALITSTGECITELTAVLTYVADVAGPGRLIPTQPLDKARCFEWLSIFSSEFHPNFYIAFKPHRFSESPELQRQLAAHGRDKHARIMQLFSARLGDGRYALGERFTAADAVLVVACLWSVGMGVDLTHYPRLQRWAYRALQRESVVRAFAEESIPIPAK